MRKLILAACLSACVAPAFSQNLSGIERWVIDWPAGRSDVNGHKIVSCSFERSGALIVLDRAGLPVRLNLLKPLALAVLVERLGDVERTVLKREDLAAGGLNVAVKQCEVDFGLSDELTVVLALASLRLRLDERTTIELAGRIESGPEFRRPAGAAAFSWSLRLRGVSAAAAGRGEFPGWPAFAERTAAWLKKEADAGNREVLALVLETKVMSRQDTQAEKRTVLSKDARSNLWIGMSVDYLMSNLFASKNGSDGVNGFPLDYHLVQPMVWLSWRGLGDPAWAAKPYRITLGLGGFFECNARYFIMRDTGELALLGLPDANGSFLFAYGPALRAEFSVVIPRFIGSRHSGDLIGLGIELLTVLNVPYFFPDYAYEYFLTQYVAFVVHFPAEPAGGAIAGFAGFDVLAGFNVSIATLDYDERNGELIIDKFGFSLGVRLNLDFDNFFASNEMFK